MNAAITATTLADNMTLAMYNVLETELRKDYSSMLHGFDEGDLADTMWDMYLDEKNELRKLTAEQMFAKIIHNEELKMKVRDSYRKLTKGF